MESKYLVCIQFRAASFWGETENSQGQPIGCKNKHVYCYEIYLQYIFAVFFNAVLASYSLHPNAESVSTPLRSSGPRSLTAGLFFSGRFTARYARGNYAANFYARFIFFFFFHVHTLTRGHPKRRYPATMLQITGRLAGNINIESLKVLNSPNTFPAFYGCYPTLFRGTTISTFRFVRDVPTKRLGSADTSFLKTRIFKLSYNLARLR